MHERRRQLHALLVAERQLLHTLPGLFAQAESLTPAVGGPRGAGVVVAVQRGDVAKLAVHPHLRIEAALLGHVPERALDSLVDRLATERTSPLSGSSTPSAMRIAVVLPAPLGPTKPTTPPSGTRRERPSSGHRLRRTGASGR